MKSTTPKRGEPAWAVADFHPVQGEWSEEEYLWLDTNRLVEYEDGFIEVLPVPTDPHQAMIAYLYRRLYAFAKKLGTVRFAAMPVRLWKKKYREPDVLFMHADHRERIKVTHWEGADLVMEVVSADEKGRKRDLVEKPDDYARGGVPEYWIVDPQERRIIVLRLKGRKYVEHGRFGPGTKATSHLLPGFEVSVNAVFKAK